jgi:diguanylate cyclase (GGDEF)-like protein
MFIALLDADDQEIELTYLVEHRRRIPSVRFPASQGMSAHVIANNLSLRYNDFDYRNPEIEPIIFSTDRTRAIIIVPLIVKGKAIGALSVQSDSPNVYTADDQEMLEMLAAHAAIAIENARLFNQLQHLAITDPLTGVFNRRHFFALAQGELERARRYSRPLSAIMLDIDHFKQVNDLFGHAIGDQTLQLIAKHCRIQLRDSDILCRYGGEEFAVLLPDTDINQARVVAERLRQEIANLTLCANDKPFSITVSIGVAAYTSECYDVEVLFRWADQALYSAKAAGRNQLIVYPVSDTSQPGNR